MILNRQIPSEGHIVHLGVALTPNGWDLFKDVDSITVNVEHYSDWHRVERKVHTLELEVLRHGISTLAAHH